MRAESLLIIMITLGAVGFSGVAYADMGASESAPVGEPSAPAPAEAAPGPEATLTQTSDAPAEPVPLGTPISATFEIRHPRDTEVLAPESWEQGRWELIESDRTQKPDESGITTTYRALFGVYRPGETTLPALTFRVVDRADGVTNLETTPITAKFVAKLNDVADLEPPQPAVAVWVDDYTLAWVGGFAGAALLGGLIAFFAFGRREEEIYVPPPRPAHEVALEKLATLAGDNLVERGEYMDFYVRLSEAVREYVGRLHRFPGTELTTSEINERLQKAVWPRGLTLGEVISLLQHCDEVKFAGRIPGEVEAQEALRRSFTIVELTRPRTDAATLEDRLEAAAEATAGDETPEASEDAEESSRWAPPATSDEDVEDENSDADTSDDEVTS